MSKTPDELEFLAAIRAAPDEVGPRLVYADWLLAKGDLRGELIVLDERERAGAATALELDRLLHLAAKHGFPKFPEDLCATTFSWEGGGSYPVQYFLEHDGHHYFLRWRSGFSIDVDETTVFEGDLDTLTTNEWTFRETNVILAVVSAAIRQEEPLSQLVFPAQGGIRAHPHFRPGRSPHFGLPEGLYDPSWRLELRDYGRWHLLWQRRQQLSGARPTPPARTVQCGCGIVGLSCGVEGCDSSPGGYWGDKRL